MLEVDGIALDFLLVEVSSEHDPLIASVLNLSILSDAIIECFSLTHRLYLNATYTIIVQPTKLQ